MLNFGFGEMALVMVLAIVVVGPDRLPEMVRFLGRQYGKLRRASNELRQAFVLEAEKAEADRRSEVLKQRREEARARAEAARARARAAAAARQEETSQSTNAELEASTAQPQEEPQEPLEPQEPQEPQASTIGGDDG